jgi:recombination protein RecT
MTETTLEGALERAQQPKETTTVLDLIERMRPEVEKSLQSEEAAQILVRHYYSAVRYNPLLMQCTGESLVAALLLSAQVRLEPGPLGHVYLVPYKNTKAGTHEVVWVVGYTGIAELARRGGAVGLRSTIVWDADEYTPPWEDERGIHYQLKPGPVEDRGARRGLLVTWTDAKVRQALDVPASRVQRAQKASAAYRAKSGPWFTDEDAMWRKTGVRAARPWLPLSVELAQASVADGQIARGVEVDAAGAAQPALVSGDE